MMNGPMLFVALFALGLGSSPLLAETKAPQAKRGFTIHAEPPFRSFSDIPENEPNDRPELAQVVGCGNSLRPASLTNFAAIPDTDWISFSANNGDLITFETAADQPGDLTDTVINLFAADGTTHLASNDDATGGSLFSRIADFSAPYTGVYYGRIRGFSASEGGYQASVSCVAPPPPPPNDLCAGATELFHGTINLSGTTRFALNDYDLCPGTPVCAASCTGFHSPGKDVVFRLEIPQAGDIIDVTYDLNPQIADASIYLVFDCGDVQGSCVAGRDSDVGTPPERLTHVFKSPGTYFLILDSFTEEGGSWTLSGCLGCPTASRPLTWGTLKTIYR